MKVQRYPLGRTNTGLVSEMRSNIMSPQQAAGLEYAKYDALAGAADATTDKILAFQKEREREQAKLDQLASTSDTATLASNLDVLKARADAERWTQEEWEEAANAEIEGFKEKYKSNISEKNRELYAKVYETNAVRYAGLSMAVGEKLHLDRTKESWEASFDRLGEIKDYRGQLMMLEEAKGDDGLKLFDPASLQKMERAVEGQVESDALMEGYKQAVQENRVDEFMMDLSETEMSDETEAFFHEKRKEYDLLTKEIQMEFDKQRAQDMSVFTQNITATTTDEEILQAAEKYDVTQYGTINMWFNQRESQKNATSIVTGDSFDPYDMKNRKDVNLLIQGNTPEERVENAIDFAAAKNIVPEYLDGYFNSRVHSNPADLMQAGEDWIRLQETTSGLPNGVKEEPRLRLNLYKTFRLGFSSEKAAQMVISHFDGLDNDRKEANRKAYDSRQIAIGNQEDMSVRDYVNKRVKDKLTELAELQLAHSQWGTDEVPRFPAEMLRFLDVAGENLYANAENEEAVADTLIQGIITSGYRVTGINDGVKTGDLELGPKWMRNPPPRPEIAREELRQDFKDKKFLINREWRTVDPDQVEFWRHSKDEETGQSTWTLRVDGALIFNEDLQKQAFAYSATDETEITIQQRTRDMLKRLEESRNKTDSVANPDLRMPFIGKQ